MRTGIFAVLLACIALALPCATVNAEEGLSCHYSSSGMIGSLTIVGAMGEGYLAKDSVGRVVAQGFVVAPLFVTPILGAAPGPLTVYVDGEVFLAIDRDADWQ